MPCAKELSGSAGEHQRLKAGERINERLGADGLSSVSDRVCGPDERGARRQELGDVVSAIESVGVEVGTGEFDARDPVVRCDEAVHVRTAVSDAGSMETIQRLPRGSERVRRPGQRPRRGRVRGSTFGRGCFPLQRGELSRASRVPERNFVTRGRARGPRVRPRGRNCADLDPLPRRGTRAFSTRVEPVSFAAITVDDANVKLIASRGGDVERAAGDWLDVAHRYPVLLQSRSERSRIGRTPGSTQHEVDCRSDHPSDREPTDHIDRKVDADIDPRDRDDAHPEPGSPSSRAPEIGTCNRRHRSSHRDVCRRKGETRRESSVQHDADDSFVGRTLRDDRAE